MESDRPDWDPFGLVAEQVRSVDKILVSISPYVNVTAICGGLRMYKHCTTHFTSIFTFNSSLSPTNESYYPYFPDKEMEAQKD